ncbi:GNAT family N-acetyltransferase [Terriglobus albidus]|uniref:GNAT family N-acetyltransferase n=1 Tax=Terriglobus albidus TaxID=1592106 RepID=UPI0021DFDE93|nr:GNAT family N-acetyltransferase [Terriglobus albidus]
MFADLSLAHRLELAEGHACLDFAHTRKRLNPESSTAWDTAHGAIAVFDGPDSPLTQTFCLGITSSDGFEESLGALEEFFFSRGAAVNHEVSPLAGLALHQLLCKRRYRPVEMSSVMYQPAHCPEVPATVDVRVVKQDEAELWGRVAADAWSADHPEFREFLLDMGKISISRENTHCFLAIIDGQPAATAVLHVHGGVALFAGSATLPPLRRLGAQSALLNARMRHACVIGCDLFMMVTEPGSTSQRNAQRNGFRIAYTRTKWQLEPPRIG